MVMCFITENFLNRECEKINMDIYDRICIVGAILSLLGLVTINDCKNDKRLDKIEKKLSTPTARCIREKRND